MFLRRDGRRDESGFTLIELICVVLIISIVMGIAIPTFMQARTRAQDRLVQKNLRSAFVAQLTYYADAMQYTDNSSGELTDIEGGLAYGTGMTPDATKDAWVALNGGRVYMSAKSRSGTCFYLREDPFAGTTYARNDDCTSALLQIYTQTPW